MGPGNEYSAHRLCQMTECERPAEWTVHVQWTVFDFLDVSCCLDDLPYTIAYWQRFSADGVEPEIWADETVPC